MKMPKKLRDLGVKGIAEIIRYGTGVPSNVTEKPLGDVVDIGAGVLASARRMLNRELSDAEFELFISPHEKIASHLAEGIRKSAQRKPIVIFLDTYEIVDRADYWLREVIKDTRNNLIWIISGQQNLADSRRLGNEFFTGYRAQFPKGLHVVPLSEFSKADVSEYFRWQVPKRKLDELSAAAIHHATIGIPLAVRVAAAIWKEGKSLEEIVSGLPEQRTPSAIVNAMTERLLMHCMAESNQEMVYALALAYHRDADLLAHMLGTVNLERTLSDLERKYSFILVEDMKLHDSTSSFVNEYLQAPVRRPAVKTIHERAVSYYTNERVALEEKLPTFADRLNSQQWKTFYLGHLHHLLWLDESEAWQLLYEGLLPGLVYDTYFAYNLIAVIKNQELLVSDDMQDALRQIARAIENTSVFSTQYFSSEPEQLKYAETLVKELGEKVRLQKYEDEQKALQLYLEGTMAFWREEYELAFDTFNKAANLITPLPQQLSEKLGRAFADIGWKVGTDDKGQPSKSPLGIQAYETALEYKVDGIYAHNNLGALYHTTGQYSEAQNVLENALEIDPLNAHIHNNLGNLYFAMEDYLPAQRAYEKAIEIDPKLTLAHINLGVLHRTMGGYPAAQRAFEKALEIDPKHIIIYVNLGNLYISLEDYPQAESSYKKALEIDPKYAPAHANLGVLYRLQERLTDAKKQFLDAHKLDPQNIVVLLALGAIHRQLEQAELAKSYIHQARSLIPAPNHYNLACLESIAGNTEAALSHLEQVKGTGLLEWARQDPDLSFVRDDPRFRALVGFDSQQ
ncbi:MAG: tetratricopeptide repeat protein [Chloroflexi bacterium]|nr:tetratricopeptide repeat protein [Chloroflexota bacterium]